MSPDKQTPLDERQVYIHPGELLSLINDDQLVLMMLDVRDEADFNLFHIQVFGHEGHENCVIEEARGGTKRLRHVFEAALGANQPGALPDAHLVEEIQFTLKVKIEKKKAVGGGCG